MLKFQKPYFIAAAIIFLTELCIAIFVHDAFIRPYIGDLLVVILIYCSVKALFNLPVWPAAVSVLIFSYIIETLQYFNIVKLLGLQNSKPAGVIIGTSFDWEDLIAYTCGIIIVILIEKKYPGFRKKNNR